MRGRLWRCTNPALTEEERGPLVHDLMDARRAVKTALQSGDKEALREARARVDTTKIALGERGPVWWTDGTPDYNRQMAKDTPYADWFEALPSPPTGAEGEGF